ncbi:hemerythrin domain-containing protein [Gordonia sp. NPDC003585]|uniref:hemerythrin domain-containing protein n=1 Tax=unclassified Gordonia (in: high G+C Gram-positive bacteria) TaxID=2657482 RepID=UPI0033BDEBE7
MTTSARPLAYASHIETTDETYPVQLRLPGQAAAPEGPIDPFMMYVVHHAFRRDLADFAACAPRTPVDDLDTWGALAERWAMFSEMLHHHHTGEDETLWPLLLGRSSDAEQVVLYAMEAEHEVIDPLLALCTAGFLRMATDDPEFGGDEGVRAELSDALARTRDVLSAHLAHEEGEAIAIVQRHMTPAEWSAFEDKMGEGSSLRDTFQMAPFMVKGLSAADRASVFARVPAILKLIVRLGEPSFRRRERRAFFYDPR